MFQALFWGNNDNINKYQFYTVNITFKLITAIQLYFNVPLIIAKYENMSSEIRIVICLL